MDFKAEFGYPPLTFRPAGTAGIVPKVAGQIVQDLPPDDLSNTSHID
jgi:hypothetical protein